VLGFGEVAGFSLQPSQGHRNPPVSRLELQAKLEVPPGLIEIASLNGKSRSRQPRFHFLRSQLESARYILIGPRNLVSLAVYCAREIGAERMFVGGNDGVLALVGIHDPIGALGVEEPISKQVGTPVVGVELLRSMDNGILVPESGAGVIELALRALAKQ